MEQWLTYTPLELIGMNDTYWTGMKGRKEKKRLKERRIRKSKRKKEKNHVCIMTSQSRQEDRWNMVPNGSYDIKRHHHHHHQNAITTNE